MTQFEVGDKVRMEGTVVRVDHFGRLSVETGGAYDTVFGVPGNFTLVERPPKPLAVGDTVNHKNADRAPAGTVIAGSFTHQALLKENSGSWRASNGYSYLSASLRADREVIHVPPSD